MAVKLINAFKIHLALMHLFGFSISENRSMKYKVYSIVVIVTFIVIPPSLTVLNFSISKNVELAEAIQVLFLTMQLVGLILKSFSLLLNFDGVKKGFDIIKSDLFNQHYLTQEWIFHEHIKIVKRNTIFFLFITVTSISIWTIGAILSQSGELPIDIWLPFDVNNKIIYVTVFIYIVTAIYIEGLFHGVLDTLCSGLIIMASAQIRVLKNTLSNLEKFLKYDYGIAEEENDQFIHRKNKVLYKKIRHCIKHHQAVVAFVEVIQRTYTTIMFCQFATSAVIICFTMFLLTIVPIYSYQFAHLCSYMFIITITIYQYSYYGTELYYESNTISEAIYLGNWYNYDIKSRKALIILMECTKRPMLLKGGNVLDISIKTFTMIMRSAYSLLAVLQETETVKTN